MVVIEIIPAVFQLNNISCPGANCAARPGNTFRGFLLVGIKKRRILYPVSGHRIPVHQVVTFCCGKVRSKDIIFAIIKLNDGRIVNTGIIKTDGTIDGRIGSALLRKLLNLGVVSQTRTLHRKANPDGL